MVLVLMNCYKKYLPLLLSVLFLSSLHGLAAESPFWVSVGPHGGDARSFAAMPSNPRHIYLGTTSSWIYESVDGGTSWKRLSKVANTDDFIIDNIVVDAFDPQTLYVGAWVVDHPDGGLFISHDGGKTWTASADMHGQSIRALSQAPSNPKILIAGTLKGVYRSTDGAAHWSLITPEGSNELHEVESIAIDPADPSVIYAGTWHLPWKTTNGGQNWFNIKQGVIDDSDVFSIIIDPKQPTTVFASACSGIYKSQDSGSLFHKVQGIPSTARRTRVLLQDPVNHNIVYAGTTEGLYRTSDGGDKWQRMTGPDVIINDVYVDPSNPQHVLLATDRSGVLASQDGSVTFMASNTGFSQRQVESLLVDRNNPSTLYAGVVNDKSYGGVFISSDGGSSWKQQSDGLDGRDVFSISQAADGTLLAGTNRGAFRWTGSRWVASASVVNISHKTTYVFQKKKKVPVVKEVSVPGPDITGRVNSIDANGKVWFLATTQGIYETANGGSNWHGGPVLGVQDYSLVRASGDKVLAANRRSLALSTDSGETWTPLTLPLSLTSIHAIEISANGSFWIGGREGLWTSDDSGKTWKQEEKLPFRDVNGLTYDSAMQSVFVTSWRSTWVYAVNLADKSWKSWDAGWSIHAVRSSDGRLLAASVYDGVLLQPAMTADVHR
jgi:photosystem II stability/assembly factor-like uncharacterized protein